MSKKWSQFDPFTALTGDEEIVGLQGGTNKRGAVNGVFKTFFDDLYWPLGGAAGLTGAVTVDGNGFDLTFGSPDELDEFNVFATNAVHLHVDDGSSHIHALFNSTGLELLSDNGVDSSEISLSPTLQSLNTTGGISWTSAGVINFTADDGVDSSDFTLQPDLFSLSITGDINLVSDNLSVAKATGLSVIADDGIDSSSLSLNPTTLSTVLPEGGDLLVEIGQYAVTDNFYFHLGGLNAVWGLNLSDLSQSFFQIDTTTLDINIQSAGDVNIIGDEFIIDTAFGIRLTPFVVSALPVTAQGGLLAFCTDEVGGEVPVFTNNSGTWLKITDGSPPVGP